MDSGEKGETRTANEEIELAVTEVKLKGFFEPMSY